MTSTAPDWHVVSAAASVNWSDVPIGLIGNAGGIGVLTLIVVYLLRVNSVDRKESAERLVAITRQDDSRLDQERTDHTGERAWLQAWYEGRIQKITESYQREISDLRAEIVELRGRLNEAEGQLRKRKEVAS